MHAYRLSHGESRGNDNVHRSHQMITHKSICDGQYGHRLIELAQRSKRDPSPTFKFLGQNISSTYCVTIFKLKIMVPQDAIIKCPSQQNRVYDAKTWLSRNPDKTRHAPFAKGTG